MEKQDSTSNVVMDALAPVVRRAAADTLRHRPQLDAAMLPHLEAAALAHGRAQFRQIMREWKRAEHTCSLDEHMRRSLVAFLCSNIGLCARRNGGTLAERPLEILEPYWTPMRIATALDHDPVLGQTLARFVIETVHDTAARVVRRFGGLRHLTDDLVQNAVVDLYAVGGERSSAPGVAAYKLRKWDPQGGKSLQNYIRFVTLRFIRKDLRRRLQPLRRTDDIDSLAVPVFIATPSPDAAADLEQVMASLTPLDRRLIELTVQGCSSREIAEQLGLPSENAVNVRKSRVRSELRKMFPGFVLGRG